MEFERGAKIQKTKNLFIPDLRLFLKTRWKVIFFCLLGIALLEVFVFNAPTWQTLLASPNHEPISSFGTSGLRITSGGFYVQAPNNAQINIKSEAKIKYLKFQDSSLANPSKPQTISYSIGAVYPGDTYIHFGNSMKMCTGVDNSLFINAGSYVKNVVIRFDEPAGTFIPLDALTVNPHIPYRFSGLRLFLLLVVASFWIILGPGSILWKTELDTKRGSHIFLLILSTLAIMAFYFINWFMTQGWKGYVGWNRDANGLWASYNLYGNLANSLLHGHTWLNLPISKGLLALKDPYNLTGRLQLKNAGQFSFWDHAFYHGKYYCYDGVIPAVIFFMPFELLSGGHWLPTAWAVLLAALIGAVFATLLVSRIANMYFEDATLGCTLLASWIIGMGSGILVQVFYSSFYSVPESSSYMFTLAGMWCWLKSIETQKVGKEKGVSPTWAFFGSLFMACNVGCRPQFVFFGLLAIPIFWTSVFKDRLLFSKKSIWASILIVLPIIIIFALIFLYNYDRFGSIFNFGENYNLTGFNMTTAKRPSFGFLLPIVVFYYLFQPLNLTAFFPFVDIVRTNIPLWYPIDAAAGGGYFTFVSPFSLILFAAPWIYSEKRTLDLERTFCGEKKSVKNSIISLICMAVAFGTALLFIDCQWCGFSHRYLIDFGSYYTFVTVFVLYTMLPKWVCVEREGSYLVKLTKLLLVFFLTVAFLCEFFAIFTPGRVGSTLYDSSIYNDPNNVNVFRVASWFLFM